MDKQELDFTKLKYVLYARKSTDDPQRQVKFIGDQIFECKQLGKEYKRAIVLSGNGDFAPLLKV